MFPEDLPQLCNHERYEVNVTIKRILVLMTVYDGPNDRNDFMARELYHLYMCFLCSHPTCWFLHTAGGKEKR